MVWLVEGSPVQQLVERRVPVDSDPPIELFIAQTAADQGRVLLVIHGGPDWNHSYLRDPLTALGGERRVVFVDLRGCGRSTRGLPAAAYTPANAVSDLMTVMDELVNGPVDVLGFSYGGMLPSA